MKKTYWWRCLVIMASLLVVATLFFYEKYLCFPYSENDLCFSHGFKKAILEPTLFFSLSLLAVAPFLFFVRDKVFLRWGKMAIVWFVVTMVLVALAPEYSGGWGPSLEPSKEDVSIWSAGIFFATSLIMLLLSSKKEVRN